VEPSYTDNLTSSPRIDSFTFGKLVERDGLDFDLADYEYDHAGLFADAVIECVMRASSEVAETLTRSIGVAALFASLWKSPEPDTRYPLTSGVADPGRPAPVAG